MAAILCVLVSSGGRARLSVTPNIGGNAPLGKVEAHRFGFRIGTKTKDEVIDLERHIPKNCR